MFDYNNLSDKQLFKETNWLGENTRKGLLGEQIIDKQTKEAVDDKIRKERLNKFASSLNNVSDKTMINAIKQKKERQNRTLAEKLSNKDKELVKNARKQIHSQY